MKSPVDFRITRGVIADRMLKITGIARNLPGIESFLLSVALEVIDELHYQCEGNVMEFDTEIVNIPGKVQVQFQIIFKSEMDLEKALIIMQELG